MILEIKLTIENPEISGGDWFGDWEEYKWSGCSCSSMLLTVKTDDGIFNFRGFDGGDDAFHDFVDKFRTFYQKEFFSDEERKQEALTALSLMEDELTSNSCLFIDFDADKLEQIQECIHDICFDNDGTFFDDEAKSLWADVCSRLNKIGQRARELSQKSIEKETSAE